MLKCCVLAACVVCGALCVQAEYCLWNPHIRPVSSECAANIWSGGGDNGACDLHTSSFPRVCNAATCGYTYDSMKSTSTGSGDKYSVIGKYCDTEQSSECEYEACDKKCGGT